VVGYSSNPGSPAVYAFGGLKALSFGGVLAGDFNGDVLVSGDLFLPGADCAEQFEFSDAEDVEAGTVVIIDQKGALRQSDTAYDRKVAGVVSGAGEYRPGIILGKQRGMDAPRPVALVGRVFCKVDAAYAPISVGDLLTTSPTPGQAMRVEDPLRALGAVIGKALGELAGGRGLVPILVCLQ
jgi:hypothetical protein